MVCNFRNHIPLEPLVLDGVRVYVSSPPPPPSPPFFGWDNFGSIPHMLPFFRKNKTQKNTALAQFVMLVTCSMPHRGCSTCKQHRKRCQGSM